MIRATRQAKYPWGNVRPERRLEELEDRIADAEHRRSELQRRHQEDMVRLDLTLERLHSEVSIVKRWFAEYPQAGAIDAASAMGEREEGRVVAVETRVGAAVDTGKQPQDEERAAPLDAGLSAPDTDDDEDELIKGEPEEFAPTDIYSEVATG